MIYEKPAKKKIDYISVIVMLGVVSIVIFVCFLHFYISFSEIVGGSAKLTEIINSIAQLATAGAFLLAVHQYRKNSKKERQEKISMEASLLIKEMVNSSDIFRENKKFSLEEFNAFIVKMENFGTGFHVLYDDLDDDIYKAVVRMHWQNMFFNHLHPTLKNLDIKPLLLDLGIENDKLERIFSEAEEYSKNKNFEHYEKISYILNYDSLPDNFRDRTNDVFKFKRYYLDDKELNDLLYGLLSRIDIRIVCPFLAVLDDFQQRTQTT
ncbi:TPA: hypothetical protein NJ265_003536 [Vibrio parahaemolyticus]|nr:hypothetical protein [Vibrio alginolyticus]TOH02676.1 hypothetical protein CGI88_18495 [Vibrio parahaemolyticus]TOP89903.1 hypothetical protein CGH07_16585 [Vibrio parahaemolyticus]HCG6435398.1 hypothetical protein [Vibrio parahaemolyticus]